MEPDGCAVPWCLESCFPHRTRGVGIDLAVKGSSRLPGFSVIDSQRSAAKEVVLPRWWPTGRVDPLQGSQELTQRDRKLAQIGDALDSRGLAFEPPVDGPLPGITVGRCPLGQRDRDRKREERRKLRQPSVFLLHLQRVCRS